MILDQVRRFALRRIIRVDSADEWDSRLLGTYTANAVANMINFGLTGYAIATNKHLRRCQSRSTMFFGI